MNETLAGPGSHRGSPRAVAGRQGVIGADAEVSGVPGVVSEWLQVVRAVRSIFDQIYRDGIMVADPRSPADMQLHD
jgi:hypothetical protein